MMRSRKPAASAASPASSASATDDIVQVKVWLLGVSPLVWRRILVPSGFTLRELHGVIQIAMGWEAIHLYQFSLCAVRYGSSELASSSTDTTLAALRLRKGSRFLYEYDLNIPWRHGVRIEERLARPTSMTYPSCTGGSGACPPEDCHDPAGFMDGSVHGWSWEALEDLGTMAEIIGPIVLERRTEILDDEQTRWRPENALDRTRARERAKGKRFSRRAMAETIIGLDKAEVIWRRGPWRNIEAVEYSALEWVDWFNNRRLLEPIGDVPPAEFEKAYYQQQESLAVAA